MKRSSECNWSEIGQTLDRAEHDLWTVVEEMQRCGATIKEQAKVVQATKVVSMARISMEKPAGDRWDELRAHRYGPDGEPLRSTS